MKLREEEFYEQYHQHGGTTIIPTEIFNELYDDATEEIERQKEIIKQLDIKNLELTTIIKEVRECINHYAIENEDYSKIYNDEVEIIEEDKKIEKLGYIETEHDNGFVGFPTNAVLTRKINEIIDYINKGD